MSGWQQSAVTIAVFLPALGAIVIGLAPAKNDRALRVAAIGFTGAALAVGIAMLFGFDYSSGAIQFEVSARWIAAIGVNYHVGVDGISLALFELTLLLTFLTAIY
jgi:NADH-quinone oxidoreductase subunit M